MPLTPRQLQILDLLRLGLQNKQIADRLGISWRTVKVQLSAIYERIQVTNRTQAVMWYLDQ